MLVTGTHFNYYQVCKRKLWLFANGVTMEDTSDLVYEGKVIHETTYLQRSDKYKEVEINGVKLDYYDTKNKVIHEIKKSRKEHESHLLQLKYYIYKLELAGIEGVSGILEYPKERITEDVFLTEPDREMLGRIEGEIPEIIAGECPEKINKTKCKKCSYYDFCYSGESDDNQVNGL